MPELYIPTLHTFAMKNAFTGSCGLFRFRIVPDVVKSEANDKEVDFAKSSIQAEYWHGELCYEKSTVEEIMRFPMSEEGRESLKTWLQSKI